MGRRVDGALTTLDIGETRYSLKRTLLTLDWSPQGAERTIEDNPNNHESDGAQVSRREA